MKDQPTIVIDVMYKDTTRIDGMHGYIGIKSALAYYDNIMKLRTIRKVSEVLITIDNKPISISDLRIMDLLMR